MPPSDEFEDKKAFMGKRKSAWNLRLANSNEHLSKRVREVSWHWAQADIADRHPGETQQEYRKRLADAT
eukprot:8877477-Alexandrium_andersonii.AAC.1